MKRQRGRGRKPAGHHPNRNFESSGPDLKIRGSAAHIYEKYLQLARDASSSGDRVMAENYLQHAEHYFRILRAMQPQHVTPQFEQRFDQSYDVDLEEGEDGEDGDGEGGEEAEAFEAGQGGGYEEGRPNRQHRNFDGQRQGQGRNDRRDDRRRQEGPRADGSRHDGPRHDGPRQDGPRQGSPQNSGQGADRPDPAYQGGQAQGGAQAGGEGEFAGEGQDGEFRGRRRRRGRFRPVGDDRAPREGGEQPSIEGFGDSAPAFLGGD
jgi:hypothetical protein